MVYLMCLGGGWMADRITGQRRAVLIGGIFIAAGEFCLFVPSGRSILGLVLLMFGTGLLKGNVSTIVGQLYPKGDPRRDSGFSIFYMGINLGALISPHHLRLRRREDQLAAGLRAWPARACCSASCSMCCRRSYLGEAGPASGDAPATRKRTACRSATRSLAVGVGLGVFALRRNPRARPA